LKLVAQNIDVAIRFGHLKDSSVVAAKLGKVVRYVVASAEYLKGRRLPTEPDKLKVFDCVMFNARNYETDWDLVCGRKKVRVHITGMVSSRDCQSVTSLVLRGRVRHSQSLRLRSRYLGPIGVACLICFDHRPIDAEPLRQPQRHPASMSEHMHHKFAKLHESLLHGKLPRSMHWSDIVELIGHLGQVQAHGGDEFAFVIGGRRELFKRPHTPELGVEEVSRLRKFLKEVGSESLADQFIQPRRAIVIIDHHAAHIFSDRGEADSRDAAAIKPYDPHHFHHHLVHRKEAHYEGDRVPEETSFYAEVTAALVSANEIVLVGSATGKSSALSALEEYLARHRIDILRRVKATEIVDLSALSEPEIEAIAKRHMIAVA
jgi:LysR substrate binding domain